MQKKKKTLLNLKSIVIEEELETLETWNLQSIALELKNQGFVTGHQDARPSIELYDIEIGEESL